MDSCVTAAIAGEAHRLAFLHADYGQRTEARERACYEALADHFREVVRMMVLLG
jgi:7-cyano-7-deazaguanine synthase